MAYRYTGITPQFIKKLKNVLPMMLLGGLERFGIDTKVLAHPTPPKSDNDPVKDFRQRIFLFLVKRKARETALLTYGSIVLVSAFIFSGPLVNVPGNIQPYLSMLSSMPFFPTDSAPSAPQVSSKTFDMARDTAFAGKNDTSGFDLSAYNGSNKIEAYAIDQQTPETFVPVGLLGSKSLVRFLENAGIETTPSGLSAVFAGRFDGGENQRKYQTFYSSIVTDLYVSEYDLKAWSKPAYKNAAEESFRTFMFIVEQRRTDPDFKKILSELYKVKPFKNPYAQ